MSLEPAYLDQLLDVRAWINERKRASFRFAHEIANEAGERIATGSTLHACWDPQISRRHVALLDHDRTR